MARIQSPPILSQIRVARSYSEQAAALRALKDEVIGHTQRKERWIENGILESLVKNLQAIRSPARQNGDDSRAQAGQPRSLADNEVVRLQSLQLIASFACGGPSYLAPLHAAGAIPAILLHISPLDNPPQVVLTALRALSNITDATRLAPPGFDDTNALSEPLFKPQHLVSLQRILTRDSKSMVVQEQKCLVAGLISRLCKGAHHQNLLANHGILDALATLLASFVVLRGEVIPGADAIGRGDGFTDVIPDPAPLGANLALVLEAISTIIADSRFRACMLICSPAIMAVFPNAEFSLAAKEARVAWNALEASGLSGLGSLRPKNPGAMDYLLPIVPITQPRSLSSQFTQFPPLGFSPSAENLLSSSRPSAAKFSGWDSSRFDSTSSNGDAENDDPESALVPWLIHLVRSTDWMERVMAASVLASLYKAGFANPEREVGLGLLVVPLLCQLIKSHDKEMTPAVQNSAYIDAETAMDWAILERAPAVLARLVADSDYLQQTAYECGAMKAVQKLLKDAYEPLPVQTAPRPWSPSPPRSDNTEGLPTCRVGPPGQLPIYAHKIKMRESSLKLVAGLAAHKEEYRKALAEQEIVPYVVESLSSTPRKPRMGKEKAKAAEEIDGPSEISPYGVNPNSVILAACHVIRVLSRSVSNLRTALEDHGVAIPIFKLLRHPEAEIQIAACGAVCNLVLNCSPMRKSLLEAGILKVLCEHAHSLNPGLRLNAMWALKALVEGEDNQLKKQALEELESGWLVQLICDDTEDEALHSRMKDRRSTDGDDDEDMDVETPEDGSRAWLSSPTANVLRGSPRMQRAEKKIAALRDAELNPTRKARNDDLAIQEQGLNFIRNLITLSSSSNIPDMVDYIFNELGQDRLFEILASKLRVKVLHPFTRKHAAGTDARVLYPQAKVIEAVVFVLVHIAASVPRHRQLVIAQTELLKLLSGHIISGNTDVRRALCHLFTNLSERDGSADVQGVEQRSLELRKLGFLAKLEELEKKDTDLDVRERAKTAVWQIKPSGA